MERELVSVIVICYNHEKFVREAIESVGNQTYDKLELIVIDDASTDNSVEVISAFLDQHPEAVFIRNEKNLGNCAAFNRAFAQSHGNYVIDLAADDVLDKDRIAAGLATFAENDITYGVNYCNAIRINAEGEDIDHHFAVNSAGRVISTPPQGDVFTDLVSRFWISAPTMMMRREVLEKLGGYDEELQYEDFDFWVRSSRDYKYCYSDKVLVRKRVIEDSLSSQQRKWQNKYLHTNLVVMKKAAILASTESDRAAIISRLQIEIRACLRTGNYDLGKKFVQLLQEHSRGLIPSLYSILLRMRIRI